MARKATTERGAAESSTAAAPRKGGRVLFTYRTNLGAVRCPAEVLAVHEGDVLDLEVHRLPVQRGNPKPKPTRMEGVPMDIGDAMVCNTWRPIPVPAEAKTATEARE